jgi:hypothetical protein
LQEAGAIRECEEHGWMQDRIDPHARERAFAIARQDPRGVSPQAAAVAIAEVLQSIGDTCPGYPLEGWALFAKDCPRRLQAARQRRLDRAHVSPAVECFAEKENQPPSFLESTDCAARVSGVVYE